MTKATTFPITLRRVTAIAAAIGVAALCTKVVEELRNPPAKRHGDRVSPWRGLPGCLQLQSPLSGLSYYWPITKGMELSCADGLVSTNPSQQPADNQPLINALYNLVEPPANALDANSEAITIESKRIAKGSDANITLDPVATAIANNLATCLTRPAPTACQAVGINPVRFSHLYEGAGVRMFALVDIRLDTGAVEAMASARTACFDRMLDRLSNATTRDSTNQDSACPEMPYQYLQANAWRKDNHALYNQAMWGSLVKPALALALLRGGAISTPRDRQWLLTALKTSDTPTIMDRLFCQRQGSASDCAPLRKLAIAGQSLGFANGPVDLLAHTATSLVTPAAHWMQRPPSTQDNQSWEALQPNMPNVDLLRDCASRRWSVCKGEDLAEITAHVWGQGDGKGTALSAANAFARLGSAANADKMYHLPTISQTTSQPSLVETEYAKAIVDGLSLTHTQGGTAHSACVAVWGTRAACEKLTTLAGKTGTPTMPHDALTLEQRSIHCREIATRMALAKENRQRPTSSERVENARCALAPYKWYVALSKDSSAPGAPWRRAVAVQVERNWGIGSKGRVDAAFDQGINVAAYVAMQYLRLRQVAGANHEQVSSNGPIVTGVTQ